jgi:hypothetical protein
MAALVGGINPTETLAQGQLSQAFGVDLFPGSAIQEAWYWHTFDR